MLDQLVQFTQSIVSTGGSFGVFMAAVLEEVIFFIPSPIVPMAGGFFLLSAVDSFGSAIGQTFLKVAIPVSLGLTLGSLFPYCICYFGGQPAIERWGRFIGLSWGAVKKTEEKFIRGYRDELILVGLRLVPVVPSSAISSFCGFIRYPIYNFIMVTFVGSLIRGFLLGLLGWYVGSAYVKYAQTIAQVEKYVLVIVGVACLLLVGWFVHKRRKKKATQGGKR